MEKERIQRFNQRNLNLQKKRICQAPRKAIVEQSLLKYILVMSVGFKDKEIIL